MAFEAKQAYQIRSPPGEVFRALSTGPGLVRWFLSAAKIDAKSGGAFAFDWLQGYHMDGKVLECTPKASIKFGWRDPLPNGEIKETTVAFRVGPSEDGTLLELEHFGFTDPEHFAECASRWAYYLMNLKSVLENGKDLRSPKDW